MTQHPLIELCELNANLGELSSKLRFDLFKLEFIFKIKDKRNKSSKLTIKGIEFF
jgi:hypothetical protein